MAEGPTRRACNRCHAQKLSCRRNGDEPCERCLRLKTECKSSLSLRFRRNRLSLEKSPQREIKPSSKGSRRSVAAVPLRCPSPRLALDTAQQLDLGHEQGRGLSSPAAAIVPLAGTESVLKAVDCPYSSLRERLFTPGSSPAAILHTIPRVASVEDLPGLDRPWSPSYQASGSFADWTQPSSASSYGSSPSDYQYTTSSSFACLDPQQLRFDVPAELCEADPGTAQQVQQQAPRRILLRRSSVDRMAAQGKLLAQLSDINTTLWDLSSQVPYLVESGEDFDVYACQRSSRNTESSSNADAEDEEGFPIQSMFEASERLVQVLGNVSGKDGVADVRQADLDPGTALLALSTYVRLLDLYQRVFQLVCAEVSGKNADSTFRLCRLPNVSVGSFPVASAVPLQKSLTVRLAEDFLSNLRTATALFGRRLPGYATGGQQGGGHASLWSVVHVSFTAVREREQDASRDLVGLRCKLEMNSAS